MIRERADDRAWQHAIFDRVNIRRTCAEHARRGSGEDDARLQYSLEWAFFTRCQWGEFDTALYELEHCWGRQPEPPSPIGGQRPASDRVIGCLDDVHAAIEHYVATIPYEQTRQHRHLVLHADRLPPGRRRRNGGRHPPPRASRSGRARHLFLVHQRGLPDGLRRNTPRRSSSSSAWAPSRCPTNRRASFNSGRSTSLRRWSAAIRGCGSRSSWRRGTPTRPSAPWPASCPT